MQIAIRTNGVINCYSEPQLVLAQLPPPPPSRNVAGSLRLGIGSWLCLTWMPIFRYRTCGGPNSEWGSKALKPLLQEREQGTWTSESCVRIASHRGHQYVGAWPGPPTEHPRLIRLSREWNPRQTLYAKSHSNGVMNCYSENQLVLLNSL